ncbi:MAG: PhoX family phosphatase, partial [Xanthomonadales bacterium]|nr:PhoX family phosphatase [Xanthomonadales bacterium]
MSENNIFVNGVDCGDEPLSNHSDNTHFAEILERRLSRRELIGGTFTMAVAGMLGTGAVQAAGRGAAPASAGQSAPAASLSPALGFDPIPVTRADSTTLPEGYRAQVLCPWGTPITGSYPAYDGVNGNSGEEQEQQVGSHHDGMHYFPMRDDPNGHGLLCINHEYVDQRVLHVKGPTLSNGVRPTDEVRKEIAAHGVSVVEVRKSKHTGEWEVVQGSRYNRRITAGTPIEIRGPVRRSDLVKTKYSRSGTMTRGTINNCAHGYTPWGTYLTCEENWAGYFKNDVQSSRISALFDRLGFDGENARQGDYTTRYDAGRNEIIGVIDETVDQKITSNVYTQSGSTLTDAGRNLRGEFNALLAANGIDIQIPREHSRYGVPTRSRYGWELAESGEDQYVRFDASVKGSAVTDYHNEPNTMGWMVEIDPFNPGSPPRKRTAMGRFAHEGCVFAPPRPNQPLAFYMGDDARFEYVYKFVTRYPWRPGMRGGAILDYGTLYVAKFNEDGSGEWLALDIRDRAFRSAAAAAGVVFRNQADVLVNTRLAADVVGATKMDRPEWGACHPETGEVYMTMTNNTNRTEADAANPRTNNATGHIIRWREEGNRSWATRFEWDIFVLAGPDSDSQVLPAEGGPALDEDNIFASPDGVWIDQNGILWIQTDMSGSQQGNGPFGENGMLAANPVTGEIKRFLSGPFNQECTGVVSTPDGKNLFVNFQHPGDRSGVGSFTSNWPDSGSVYRHPGDPIPTVDP